MAAQEKRSRQSDWAGWHIGLPHVAEEMGIRLVRTALDRGINFLDNCWDYNDGLEHFS